MNFPRIPGYEIEAFAGRGGMGGVYRARQRGTNRHVALKLLTNRAPDTATLAAFRREAELIAGLEHPHILPVYDFGQEQGIPYLVMRYLGGGSLADKIDEGAVALETAVRWLNRLADALDFAHQRGIVHKDVKPSNALLDNSGQVYLADFGIAGTMQAVGEGVPLGSAAYMSPEQCRGQAVDARSDVYALAVMLFELLTGQKPYTAETALGIMSRQIHDPVPSARALNPAIPPAVEVLITRGMAKDPAQRPASAAEFSRELNAAVTQPRSAAVLSPVVARSGRTWLWWLIGGLLLITFCLVTLIVATGGGIWLVSSATATPPPAATRPARLETPTPTGVPAGELLRDDFRQPFGGFATGGDADGGVTYDSGALVITALTNGVEWFSPSGRVTAADLIMEVTARAANGNAGGYLGLICRWQDINNYTLLALNAAGEAAIWQKEQGETTMLADWRGTAITVRPEETIRLRAVCNGRELRFSANNILLVTGDDPNPVSGDIALMAGLGQEGEWRVSFSDLLVVEP